MSKYLLSTFLFLLLATTRGVAACGTGQDEIIITIVPDLAPNETSWELRNNSSNLLYASGTFNSDTICIPSGQCLRFVINDAAGDGLCCGFGNGSYSVKVNGVLAASGGQFLSSETRYVNCPPGSSCDNALVAQEGIQYNAANETWYSFTPDSTGSYTVTTCNLGNGCNTKLWIYDHCTGLVWNNTNAGTYAYNDNECGFQAEVGTGFTAGETYFIRVGGTGGGCNSINWLVNFNGPVVGCMDSSACNFSPLATVSDGNCIYPGDPLCPNGPDLSVDLPTIVNSLQIDNITASACYVQEGCLAGYNDRQLLRFSTRIDNIGNQDYYIGPPQTGNQFVFDACHGHWHYVGYASYELYDSLGNQLEVGFKNGFCVLDLMCFTGTAQYGCGNMGISAGCADEYSSGLSCQWLDITDVDSGQYTLVVKVNWDHTPDALGRIETDWSNNSAAVCFRLHRDASNVPSYTLLNNCPDILDCQGNAFGNAQLDCNGICNGPNLNGDLDIDHDQDSIDLTSYLVGITQATMTATVCNDLNGDNTLTVTDAARLNGCIRSMVGNHTHPGTGSTAHSHCDFPHNVLNPGDTITLGLTNLNTTAQSFDVTILSPNCRTLGLEFLLQGVVVDSVVCMNSAFTPSIHHSASGHVTILAEDENSLLKILSTETLLRVYYSSVSSNPVCISEFRAAVNSDYEEVVRAKTDDCFTISGIQELELNSVMKLQPNPSNGTVSISVGAYQLLDAKLEITNTLGERVYLLDRIASNTQHTILDLRMLPAGVYNVKATGNGWSAMERLILVK